MAISKKMREKFEEISKKMAECHAEMSEASGGCCFVAISKDGEVYTGFEPTDNFVLSVDTEIARFSPYSWTDCEPDLNPETEEEWTKDEIQEKIDYYKYDYDADEHLGRIIEECAQSEMCRE